MKTLPEIRSMLVGQVAPILSNDSIIVKNHELVYELVDSARATLVKQDYRNRANLDGYYQTHVYATAATKTSIYINSVEYPFQEPVIEIPIPSLHGGIGFKDIQYFGGMDWKTSFHRMSVSALRSKRYMHYSGNNIAYAVLDSKIILSIPHANASGVKQNNIRGEQKYWMLRGVFGNPRDVYHYDETAQAIKQFNVETRGNYTVNDYPFPEHKLEKLQILILPKLRDMINQKADIVSDAVDTTLNLR